MKLLSNEKYLDISIKVLVGIVLFTAISPFIFSISKSMTRPEVINFENTDNGDVFGLAMEKSKNIKSEVNPSFISYGESFQEFQGTIIEGAVFESSSKGIKVDSSSYYFNPMNLRELSNADAAFLDIALRGTNLEGLGQSFVDAETLYGVNAIFLTGLAIHESNFGKSRIAIDKNNLFGMGAFDADPYNEALVFKEKRDSILFTAGYLSREYLSDSGKYHSGYAIFDVNLRYATDKNWANAIITRIENHIMK